MQVRNSLLYIEEERLDFVETIFRGAMFPALPCRNGARIDSDPTGDFIKSPSVKPPDFLKFLDGIGWLWERVESEKVHDPRNVFQGGLVLIQLPMTQ